MEEEEEGWELLERKGKSERKTDFLFVILSFLLSTTKPFTETIKMRI